MPDFNSSQYPLLYRAISKRGWLEDLTAAFMRKPDEDGLSVLISVNCSVDICSANLNKCFGEYVLPSDGVERLGLTIKLDSPNDPFYSENHAEILGLPLRDADPQMAEYLASLLADLIISSRIADPPFKKLGR